MIFGCYSSYAGWLPNEKQLKHAFWELKPENDTKKSKNMLRQLYVLLIYQLKSIVGFFYQSSDTIPLKVTCLFPETHL